MALTDNLVSYWKLDGNSNDSAGTDNGSDSNVSYNSSYGIISQGASFDRTSPSQIDLAGAGSLSTGTFACWIKGSFSDNNADYGILSTSDWDSSGDVFFYIRRRDSEGKTARMGYNIYGDSAELYADSDLSTSNWNFCVWTWDISNKKVNFILNASNIGSDKTTTTMVNPNLNSNTRIGNGILTGRGYTGYLDEIGLWSRVLSSTEITTLYNSGAGLTYPFSTSSVKSVNGLAKASVKSKNGLAIASIKSFNGLA